MKRGFSYIVVYNMPVKTVTSAVCELRHKLNILRQTFHNVTLILVHLCTECYTFTLQTQSEAPLHYNALTGYLI
jgi:hypothetical protein